MGNLSLRLGLLQSFRAASSRCVNEMIMVTEMSVFVESKDSPGVHFYHQVLCVQGLVFQGEEGKNTLPRKQQT